MPRFRVSAAIILVEALFIPAAVYAQASVTGTVKDASGAVLPGVTVEAASPALIEKVRTGVTDGTGQYRIEDLRPGTYSVTFTLTGFSTVKREGIELTGSFTATVNTELTIGSLQETIVVTGETPIVDVQSATRQSVVSKETIAALPTSGGYSSLLALTPGILGGTQDVATGPCACTFSAHGAILSSRANSEGRTMLDGLLIAVPQAASSNYLSDTRSAQEVTFTVSGSLGEVETGGPVMNIVPRTGGNSLSGNLYAADGPTGLEGSNYTQSLKAQGLTAPAPFTKNYDYSGFLGGPILRDRIWFFTTARDQGNSQVTPNLWFNQNAGNPNAWTYVPDFTRPAFTDRTYQNASLRLTAQVTPRNKVSIFDDEQWICRSCQNGGSGLYSPEANSSGDQWPVQVKQLTWSSPVTNKLLLEFGVGQYQAHWGARQKTDPYTGDLVKVVEQCTAGCPANGNIPGLTYRSQSDDLFVDGRNLNQTFMWRGSVSYVTGAWSFKAGYTANLLGDLRDTGVAPNALAYRFNNGVPNQLTQYITSFENNLYERNDAFFAQQQWTYKRLTLQGAVRFDRLWSWAPPQQEGPTQFLPTPLVYPSTPSVDSYKDVDPRGAVAYDLFGDGKTALKGTFGRYLEATNTNGIYGSQNPTSRIISSVTRTWTDANGNFIPDCNLLNPAVQDLRSSGGDFCGALSNQNFGKSVVTNTLDPALLNGWGVRPSDWDFGVSIQREVMPRLSVNVGYFWRWFQGFVVTDNLAVRASDFTPFSITAPLDPRLPNGGGYTVGSLYDVNPALFGVTNNFVTNSNNFGNQYQRFHGIDISVQGRPRGSLTYEGSVSAGRTVADSCEIRAALPETAPLNPFCHIETGLLPQVKALVAYIVPRVDVQFSAIFTSKPGLQVSGAGTPTTGGVLSANYTVSNAVVAQSLGRSLAGNAPNVTVNLIPPGSLYGDRVNEVDLRLGKILKLGKTTRATVGIDIYNLLNAAPILAYNQAYIAGGAWLTPTQVMTARFAKLSAQFDF
jgi:hypothetical protein